MSMSMEGSASWKCEWMVVMPSVKMVVPPMEPVISSRATFRPSCAARTAAEQPAAPAPTTTKSTSTVWETSAAFPAAFASVAEEEASAARAAVAAEPQAAAPASAAEPFRKLRRFIS